MQYNIDHLIKQKQKEIEKLNKELDFLLFYKRNK